MVFMAMQSWKSSAANKMYGLQLQSRQAMRRIFQLSLPGMLALAAALYIGDYAIWRTRMSHGSGAGTIAVDQYLATPLKGNKAEYDFLGTVQQPCSRSLAPHGGMQPCWWLARHTSQWQ
jgi:hypothetical protein